MNPFILWVLGLILIYLEFYLPGAVMGVTGGLLIIASLFLFIIQFNSPLLSLLYFVCVAASVVLLIKYALWRIPRTKSDRGIYSAHDQEGYQASGFDASAIGKTGVVLSDLKPGGYIEVESKQHQAISESGYLQKGEEVVVLRGEGESLIVRRK